MHHVLYEILYVDKGSLICKYNNTLRRISSGQIFIIDKNTRYYLDSENENTAFVSIVFNTKNPLSGALVNRTIPGNLEIFRKFKNIINENENASLFYLDIIISELNILLVELIRSLVKTICMNCNPEIWCQAKNETVQEVLNYIDANIMSAILRLKKSKFFLTSSYLSKYLRKRQAKLSLNINGISGWKSARRRFWREI